MIIGLDLVNDVVSSPGTWFDSRPLSPPKGAAFSFGYNGEQASFGLFVPPIIIIIIVIGIII